MFDAFASGDWKNHKIHTNNAFIDTTAMQEKLGGRLLFLLFPEWEEGYKIVHSEIKRKFPKWAFIEGKMTKIIPRNIKQRLICVNVVLLATWRHALQISPIQTNANSRIKKSLFNCNHSNEVNCFVGFAAVCLR